MCNPHNECPQYKRFILLKSICFYHGKTKYPNRSPISLVLPTTRQSASYGVVVRLINSTRCATGVSTATATTIYLILENYRLVPKKVLTGLIRLLVLYVALLYITIVGHATFPLFGMHITCNDIISSN